MFLSIKSDEITQELFDSLFADKLDNNTLNDKTPKIIPSKFNTYDEIDLKAGEFKLISLGVSMQLPAGYEAHVVPRSSTFKNYGIIQTNHQGVIDNSYCGDNDVWKFPAYALKDTHINKYDRICQFRIIEKQPQIMFNEVETLGNEDRGGFGITGTK